MSLAVFRDRLWDLALVLGGVSIVARVRARQSWKHFEATLKVDRTHNADEIPLLREWDFRYWNRIGLVAAELSILCSGVWLMSKLIYL